MKIQQAEQAILAAILVDRGAFDIVRPELTGDKFIYGPADKFNEAHRLIYEAMLQSRGRVDVVSVLHTLGEDVEKAGGETYIRFLATAALQQLAVRSTEGLPQWMRLVDAAGRLKQVGDIFTDYERLFQDFASLVERVPDVDAFIAQVQERISTVALGTACAGYKHIAVAAESYRLILEHESRGFIETYYPIGWPSFARFSLPPRAGLMIVSGLSGIGKSQLVLQMALGLAIQLKANNLPGCVVLNTYEMSGWRYARRFAACLAGVDYQGSKVRDADSTEYVSMNAALDFVETLPIYYDDTDMSSDQIALQCMRLTAEHGAVLFLGVDYAELVADEQKAASEEQRVSRIFRNSKALATSTGMCACVVSQVSDASMFPTKIVSYDKLRYSRAATNAADVICYVYNPPQMRAMQIPFVFETSLGEEAYAHVLVQKHRDGKVGAFPMQWTANFTRFEDLALKGFGSELYQNLKRLGFVRGQFTPPEDDF